MYITHIEKKNTFSIRDSGVIYGGSMQSTKQSKKKTQDQKKKKQTNNL